MPITSAASFTTGGPNRLRVQAKVLALCRVPFGACTGIEVNTSTLRPSRCEGVKNARACSDSRSITTSRPVSARCQRLSRSPRVSWAMNEMVAVPSSTTTTSATSASGSTACTNRENGSPITSRSALASRGKSSQATATSDAADFRGSYQVAASPASRARSAIASSCSRVVASRGGSTASRVCCSAPWWKAHSMTFSSCAGLSTSASVVRFRLRFFLAMAPPQATRAARSAITPGTRRSLRIAAYSPG